MAIRPILHDTDPALHKVCHEVTQFNGRIHDLMDDLVDTLHDSGGVGLAAPQIGILRRCVVVLNDKNEVLELINPEIIWTSKDTQCGAEGCLSVPGKWGEVTRPMSAKVRAQDRFGKPIEVEGSALTARCFCHELDHLDGHLFTELVKELYETDDEDDE